MTLRRPLGLLASLVFTVAVHAEIPLPSWNDTPNRALLLDFVERVTLPGADYVEPTDRVAVFDLDGTLVCERPDYLTTLVSHAMLRKRLEEDPTLLDRPAYRAIQDDDRDFLRKHYKDVHLEAFAGLSHEVLHDFVSDYIHTHRHPRFHRLYKDMYYLPMLELVQYLQANEFRVYIMSASMQEFIRAFSESMLGIPRENVIGSAAAFRMERRGGRMETVREPAWLEPYALNEGKAIRILERIGRRPLLAFGNGNGDIAMLRLAALNPRPSLALVLDHNDRERDMFDRKPLLLSVAEREGWPIVRVQSDFRQVWPHASTPEPAAEEEAPALEEAGMVP